MKQPLIEGVDLFCGAGGLTHGLNRAGIEVSLGVDLDKACEYPFSANNKAEFRCKSVTEVTGCELRDAWKGADLTLLAGCAPCQPFSTYSQSWASPEDERWDLLSHFARLIREAQPDLVTMENVPKLGKIEVFGLFLSTLKKYGYQVTYRVLRCVDYGVPQSRQRLVLLASRLGDILCRNNREVPKNVVAERKALGGASNATLSIR